MDNTTAAVVDEVADDENHERLTSSAVQLHLPHNKRSDENYTLPSKSSPTLFEYDVLEQLPSFCRPPVWNGSENAEAGLLGIQAPAAGGLDGIDKTFFSNHSSTPRFQSPSVPSSPKMVPIPNLNRKRKKKPLKQPVVIPQLPVEIHLMIVEQVLESSRPESCSFCRLFQLSSLSSVSRTYHSLLERHLYGTLQLGFISSLDARIGATCESVVRCEPHFRLASKHRQLELRVPLLIRTLSERPDLSDRVLKLVLPAGGMSTFLTCQLEKTYLPRLIECCPNIESVQGVDGMLFRQFFSGEHFCFDGTDAQQHGLLAKALYEKKSLKSWCWNGGNASSSEIWNSMFDRHSLMKGVTFETIHRNWTALESLEIRDVWNVSSQTINSILANLVHLKRMTLVRVRKSRVGYGDLDTVLSALEVLPSTIEEIEIGGIQEEAFLSDVGQWVRTRGMDLKSLRIMQTPITSQNLESFLSSISAESGPWHSVFPCFSNPRRSLVRRLSLDNWGFEALCDLSSTCGGADRMELVGLHELEWHVRTEKEQEQEQEKESWGEQIEEQYESSSSSSSSRYSFLESSIQDGWFGDLRRLSMELSRYNPQHPHHRYHPHHHNHLNHYNYNNNHNHNHSQIERMMTERGIEFDAL